VWITDIDSSVQDCDKVVIPGSYRLGTFLIVLISFSNFFLN